MIEQDADIRRAYGIAKGYPNMMSVEPVSIEVGSSATADDSAKAYDQLMALVEDQRKLAPSLSTAQLFERVFSALENAKLASAAHRRKQQPGIYLRELPHHARYCPTGRSSR